MPDQQWSGQQGLATSSCSPAERAHQSIVVDHYHQPRPVPYRRYASTLTYGRALMGRASRENISCRGLRLMDIFPLCSDYGGTSMAHTGCKIQICLPVKSHMMRTDWVDIEHVSSEFGPFVPWGGVYGTINAAAWHHITEGRWIRDRDYTTGLVRFWIGSQSQQVYRFRAYI